MALLAAWCAMRFGELAELRRATSTCAPTGSRSAVLLSAPAVR